MSKRAPRVGIFGGSFDPVHFAHVALASRALAELNLDQVLWVPAGRPWQKERILGAAEDREAMVRLAIADEPRFEVSRIEIERAGASFTVDTVRALRALRPGVHWYLLIGQDQYASFHTWHDWRALLGFVTLAIANRPDAPLHAEKQLLGVPHEAVTLPMMDISSTEVRERIALGRPIDDLVPGSVARYIARHHLYQDISRPPPPRS